MVDKEFVNIGKEILVEVVSMLVGLIKSNSERVYDSEVKYSEDIDHVNSGN
jgi:hypothetical protein